MSCQCRCCRNWNLEDSIDRVGFCVLKGEFVNSHDTCDKVDPLLAQITDKENKK